MALTLTSVLTLLTSLVVLVTSLLKARKAERSIQEIHVMVNNRMSDAVARINQLEQVIESSDKAIPPTLQRAEDRVQE